MRAYIGVTDGDWFKFLKAQADLDEVNFWQPGGSRQFRGLSPGELFLFKLHSPDNYIAGGGYFTHSSLLPCSLAWKAFGLENGAATFMEMRQRIEKYRRIPSHPHEDYVIGCVILQSPFFFERDNWIPVPEDWSPNIVQGKTYDLTSRIARKLMQEVSTRLAGGVDYISSWEPSRPTYGDPVLVRPRLGQGAFRVLITDIYQRRCAVTREKLSTPK